MPFARGWAQECCASDELNSDGRISGLPGQHAQGVESLCVLGLFGQYLSIQSLRLSQPSGLLVLVCEIERLLSRHDNTEIEIVDGRECRNLLAIFVGAPAAPHIAIRGLHVMCETFCASLRSPAFHAIIRKIPHEQICPRISAANAVFQKGGERSLVPTKLRSNLLGIS